MINKKFQQAVVPGEDVCIDESNVPFHGYISDNIYQTNGIDME